MYPLFCTIFDFWMYKIRGTYFAFRIWRRKFEILDICSVTKVKKIQRIFDFKNIKISISGKKTVEDHFLHLQNVENRAKKLDSRRPISNEWQDPWWLFKSWLHTNAPHILYKIRGTYPLFCNVPLILYVFRFLNVQNKGYRTVVGLCLLVHMEIVKLRTGGLQRVHKD